MRPATSALLSQFQQAQWFSAIGQSLDDPDVVRVTRWMDAIGFITDPWWEMLGYQQGLALQEAAIAADPQVETRWKKMDEELAALVRPLVARQVAPLRAERGFPAEAEMVLGYHLRNALLETELLELPEPGYFREVADWLLRGRLPCGVDESGKLRVY